ncbi:hypothetical protein [Gemmobacter caeruleus]|nr:hypothetical protein [Gemmobacter caeruleus]
MLFRRATNRVMRQGMNRMAKGAGADPRQVNAMQRKARQAARLLRRIGR